MTNEEKDRLIAYLVDAGDIDPERQIRPELDQVVVSQVRGQSGQAGTLRTGLQPGQLHEQAGLAGGDEALVVDQSANQAD